MQLNNSFMTVPEVAVLMHVSENTARKWAKAGRYGAKMHAGSYRFPSAKLLLTVEEVAEALKVNVQTVRRWAREGMHPCTKIGRRYYFPRSILLQ